VGFIKSRWNSINNPHIKAIIAFLALIVAVIVAVALTIVTNAWVWVGVGVIVMIAVVYIAIYDFFQSGKSDYDYDDYY